MHFQLKNGNWPTMLTLYDEQNQIDYKAMGQLIDWYKANNMDGLFAVCQSSEMFFLSLEERVELARFVKERAGSEMQVIASGHVADTLEEQIKEIKEISETGIDAFVLVSNRLAKAGEPDEMLKHNVRVILETVPDVKFGIYECPYPYKRLVTPDLLKWLADTGRFFFLKDTCCDIEQIKQRIEAVQGTTLKLFNANSATLLASYHLGASGYSGVMANFHPHLYSWLHKNWRYQPNQAEKVQSFLGAASLYELQQYPVNAKYNLQNEGLNNTLWSRSIDAGKFGELEKVGIEQLRTMTDIIKENIFKPEKALSKD
ncbi:dihydrodipicolinate synthase family protein [Fictibacillus enclensis]|uniref:dihydrodipicolinate synthase family protein n=1 Tax=Fictibacillus enclensis TaxID=1017270 RepID=UPI0025A0A73B|nr:dihydrodipicolinate synthase family protein [Fictibacillus enclensis]MDM5336407.1 dihydrodipicolinate synthase family protein [Fictibacillus enclensis]